MMGVPVCREQLLCAVDEWRSEYGRSTLGSGLWARLTRQGLRCWMCMRVAERPGGVYRSPAAVAAASVLVDCLLWFAGIHWSDSGRATPD